MSGPKNNDEVTPPSNPAPAKPAGDAPQPAAPTAAGEATKEAASDNALQAKASQTKSSQGKTSKAKAAKPPKAKASKKKRWTVRLLVLGGVGLAGYTVFGFFGVPWLTRWAVETKLAEQLQAQGRLGKCTFNPFTLRYTLDDLAVTDAQDQALVGLKHLNVNFSLWETLTSPGIVFQQIHVTAPALRVARLQDGSINWLTILPPPPPPEEGDSGSSGEADDAGTNSDATSGSNPTSGGESKEPLRSIPHIVVHDLAITDASLTVADDALPEPFTAAITDLDAAIDGLDLDPAHDNTLVLAFVSDLGEKLDLKANLYANPLTIDGQMALTGLDLTRYQPYLSTFSTGQLTGGQVGLDVAFRFAPVDTTEPAWLTVHRFDLTDLALQQNQLDVLTLEQLTLQGIHLDAAQRHIQITAPPPPEEEAPAPGSGDDALVGAAAEPEVETSNTGETASADAPIATASTPAAIQITGLSLTASRTEDGQLSLWSLIKPEWQAVLMPPADADAQASVVEIAPSSDSADTVASDAPASSTHDQPLPDRTELQDIEYPLVQLALGIQTLAKQAMGPWSLASDPIAIRDVNIQAWDQAVSPAVPWSLTVEHLTTGPLDSSNGFKTTADIAGMVNGQSPFDANIQADPWAGTAQAKGQLQAFALPVFNAYIPQQLGPWEQASVQQGTFSLYGLVNAALIETPQGPSLTTSVDGQMSIDGLQAGPNKQADQQLAAKRLQLNGQAGVTLAPGRIAANAQGAFVAEALDAQHAWHLVETDNNHAQIKWDQAEFAIDQASLKADLPAGWLAMLSEPLHANGRMVQPKASQWQANWSAHTTTQGLVTRLQSQTTSAASTDPIATNQTRANLDMAQWDNQSQGQITASLGHAPGQLWIESAEAKAAFKTTSQTLAAGADIHQENQSTQANAQWQQAQWQIGHGASGTDIAETQANEQLIASFKRLHAPANQDPSFANNPNTPVIGLPQAWQVDLTLPWSWQLPGPAGMDLTSGEAIATTENNAIQAQAGLQQGRGQATWQASLSQRPGEALQWQATQIGTNELNDLAITATWPETGESSDTTAQAKLGIGQVQLNWPELASINDSQPLDATPNKPVNLARSQPGDALPVTALVPWKLTVDTLTGGITSQAAEGTFAVAQTNLAGQAQSLKQPNPNHQPYEPSLLPVLPWQISADLSVTGITSDLTTPVLAQNQVEEFTIDGLAWQLDEQSLHADALTITQPKLQAQLAILPTPAPGSGSGKTSGSGEENGKVAGDKTQTTQSKPTQTPAAAQAQVVGQVQNTMQTLAEKLGYQIQIDKVQIEQAAGTITDTSTTPPSTLKADDLSVNLGPVDVRKNSPVSVAVEGRLQDSGQLSIEATAQPFGVFPAAEGVMRLQSLNMQTLSPYVGHFLGYQVKEGTHSLNTPFSLSPEGALAAKAEFRLHKFYLGDKVKSPVAPNLPIPLGLDILRDRSGAVTGTLPIAGNVNDPSFQLQGVILGSVGNLVEKTLAAPFDLIAKAFGGGEDVDLSKVVFPVGDDKPTLAEADKLSMLASFLVERPQVLLVLNGLADPQADRQFIAAQRQSAYEKALAQHEAECQAILAEAKAKAQAQVDAAAALAAQNGQPTDGNKQTDTPSATNDNVATNNNGLSNNEQTSPSESEANKTATQAQSEAQTQTQEKQTDTSPTTQDNQDATTQPAVTENESTDEATESTASPRIRRGFRGRGSLRHVRHRDQSTQDNQDSEEVKPETANTDENNTNTDASANNQTPKSDDTENTSKDASTNKPNEDTEQTNTEANTATPPNTKEEPSADELSITEQTTPPAPPQEPVEPVVELPPAPPAPAPVTDQDLLDLAEQRARWVRQHLLNQSGQPAEQIESRVRLGETQLMGKDTAKQTKTPAVLFELSGVGSES